jgi:hypothetical protein
MSTSMWKTSTAMWKTTVEIILLLSSSSNIYGFYFFINFDHSSYSKQNL